MHEPGGGTTTVVVVALTAAEAAERLPAVSLARTVYEYVVPAVRPVSVKDVPVGVPTWVPLRRTT
ncbi:hypothetical protein D3C74_400920 [compost metagenome]